LKGDNVFELGNKTSDNKFFLGSQGDKFYIILEGEVGVMVPRTVQQPTSNT